MESRRYIVSLSLFLKILNYLEFPEIIQIVKQYKYGEYTILPFIKSAYSKLPTINPYNIMKCCYLRNLSLPNSTYLCDNILMMLPQLKYLAVKSGTEISPDTFSFVPELEKLEILGYGDKMLCTESVKNLCNLRELHVSNSILKNSDMQHLKNLRVLVIYNSYLTPKILEYLPKLEFCILNGVLIKYHPKYKRLVLKIGVLAEIKIYNPI